jgi:hypothetical protein
MTSVLYTIEPSRYTNAMRFAFLFAARVENLNGRRPQARDIARLTQKTILRKFVYDNYSEPHVDDFWHMACHLRDSGLLLPWPRYTRDGIAQVSRKGIQWLHNYAPDLMASVEELRRPNSAFSSCGYDDEDDLPIPW